MPHRFESKRFKPWIAILTIAIVCVFTSLPDPQANAKQDAQRVTVTKNRIDSSGQKSSKTKSSQLKQKSKNSKKSKNLRTSQQANKKTKAIAKSPSSTQKSLVKSAKLKDRPAANREQKSRPSAIAPVSTKASKAQTKAMSAKAQPVKATKTPEQEVDEFEDHAKIQEEGDLPATSPLLYVFVLFVIGCVAGYLYLKRHQEITGHGSGPVNFAVAPMDDLDSNRSSLNSNPLTHADTLSETKQPTQEASDAKASKAALEKTKKNQSENPQSTVAPTTSLAASRQNISQEIDGKKNDTSAESISKKSLNQKSKSVDAENLNDYLMTHVGLVPLLTEHPTVHTHRTDLDWRGLDKIDMEEFWYRVKKIEDKGRETNGAALAEALNDAGFRDKEHFEQIKDAYRTRFPNPSEPRQIVNAMSRIASEKKSSMASKQESAVESPTLAGTQDLTRQDNPPCSLERFVEIREAKNAWSQQGKDAVSMIQLNFQITPTDWRAFSDYWTSRLSNSAEHQQEDRAMTERYRSKYGFAS